MPGPGENGAGERKPDKQSKGRGLMGEGGWVFSWGRRTKKAGVRPIGASCRCGGAGALRRRRCNESVLAAAAGQAATAVGGSVAGALALEESALLR